MRGPVTASDHRPMLAPHLRRASEVPARTGLPPRTRERTRPGLWALGQQGVLVVLAALCYFGVRGLTQSELPAAQSHARALVDVERALGLNRESLVQDLVISHESLVTLANWIYMYGHWPLIAITLAALFRWTPERFVLLRNAMFVSGAIGLVVFALLPVAPPRLGVLELVDTVTERSNSYRTLQPPGLINRYAALPSLHFGWNLLVGIILWQAFPRRAVRVFAVLTPAAMAFAVVATANHYIIDVVAGGAVALTGLYVARRLPDVLARPDWARPRT